MPVPFGLSQGLWHSRENSLDHRFYLPEEANTGSSIATLGQKAAGQMSEVSKRKWPKQMSKQANNKQKQKPTNKKLAAIENEVTRFWGLIFRTVKNILTPPIRQILTLSVSKPNKYPMSSKNYQLVSDTETLAAMSFVVIWYLPNLCWNLTKIEWPTSNNFPKYNQQMYFILQRQACVAFY